jgi:protein-disulfide isomerase
MTPSSLTRRSILAALATGPALVSGVAHAQRMTLDTITNDPEAPVAGNPAGDVTIVAFLDYNCPYCKKSVPELERVLATDSGVKLVYKDTPVLTEASVFGARMALAAKYQGAYLKVHNALMRVPGRRNPQPMMEDAIASSGVDIARLKADLEKHGAEIDALIKRNVAQADALGFEGVPDFIIGSFKANGYLDYDTFKSAIAQARAEATAKPSTL